MVNKDTFSNDTKYIKIIEHLSNLNFVKNIRAKATNNLYDIYVINHGNKELPQVVDSIKRFSNDKTVKVIDYDKSYLQTLKNILDDIVPKKEHYIWICSSICNYSSFDFTYICDPFARENLHVFPSDTQKFGDTFFLDVNYAKKVITEYEILQQFNKVNYNSTIRTKRIPAPVIKVNSDTHVGNFDVDFDFPYAIFTTEEFKANDTEAMNLWQDDTKELLITSTGASRIIVPKEAKDIIKNELYDYPYIKTASKLLSSKPLDIVFLSNGEKNAEENYKHLLAVTEGLKNRVVRVDGVNGRVEAYHAAVKASETPWAFTVFAKLKVSPKFDWGWQPDRLQIPKHYIFHAKNPVNGLEYGHQGMIRLYIRRST
jgi:PHD/YefM family antitoxin component YafN of YafNO toxin-antitoxin module